MQTDPLFPLKCKTYLWRRKGRRINFERFFLNLRLCVPFVFPIDHVSGERKERTMDLIPSPTSGCRQRVWRLRLSPSTNAQELSWIMTAFLPLWWWTQMQRPEGEVTWHPIKPMDGCFPHKANWNEKGPVWPSQFCSTEAHTLPSSCCKKEGREGSGWLNFSHGQQVHWAVSNVTR